MGSLDQGEKEIYISVTSNWKKAQGSNISPVFSSCEYWQALPRAAVLCSGLITALHTLRALLAAGDFPGLRI